MTFDKKLQFDKAVVDAAGKRMSDLGNAMSTVKSYFGDATGELQAKHFGLTDEGSGTGRKLLEKVNGFAGGADTAKQYLQQMEQALIDTSNAQSLNEESGHWKFSKLQRDQ
ncbi:hypothetical protein [Sciscionella marina]|uniref:hypothetical protein n=1 Tax=Sciscionella marina TaxID=508770 RepID=UPI0003795AEA|nr:hypothetical protein [Sciscionella marina]